MPAPHHWFGVATAIMAAFVVSATPSRAQTWPQRTVRLVVPVELAACPTFPRACLRKS